MGERKTSGSEFWRRAAKVASYTSLLLVPAAVAGCTVSDDIARSPASRQAADDVIRALKGLGPETIEAGGQVGRVTILRYGDTVVSTGTVDGKTYKSQVKYKDGHLEDGYDEEDVQDVVDCSVTGFDAGAKFGTNQTVWRRNLDGEWALDTFSRDLTDVPEACEAVANTLFQEK